VFKQFCIDSGIFAALKNPVIIDRVLFFKVISSNLKTYGAALVDSLKIFRTLFFTSRSLRPPLNLSVVHPCQIFLSVSASIMVIVTVASLTGNWYCWYPKNCEG